MLLVGLAAPGLVHAQETVIEGIVTDATGLVLPGVTVEARSTEAGGPIETAVTDGVGAFAITGLPPGTYDVTFTLPGFQTDVRRGVALGAGATVTLDTALSVQLEEQVVVVGSRARPRSVTESPVPIDAISFRDVMSQGATTLDYQLRNLVPSFNVATHPISGAASLVRPASLRNLAHDHTLVLVNGKRRHRAAILVWFGGVTDGTQGPDISTIPAIALRQVEVLRDGASAQYGSDAIAGVLNFLLKDAREGGSLEFNTGTYRAGDGDAYNVAGNVGLPLGDNGFANLSLEYGNAGPTDRSVQRADAAALIAAGNTAVADPAQPWGNTTSEDDLKLFGNFGHLNANGLQLYGHANYAHKTSTQGFYFRNPNTRANIFSLDGGQTLLVGDVLDARDGVRDGSAGCPTVRITDNRPDQAALARVFADPNCFSFQEIAPGGFTPSYNGVITDLSTVAGLRRAAANGLTWDASASYGAHQADFFLFNTVNASLGPETPRDFDPGLYRQAEVNLNFDVSYAATDLVHLAGGAEWRDERFTIRAGERPSWEVGPFAAQGFVSGSNGFAGFPDYTAGTWTRANVALYGDVELGNPDGRWTVGGALRVERFDVFGATANGKLSARYGLGDAVSVRGGVSTGFRAPTPGQQNTFNVQSTINPKTLDLVDSATVPSTYRAAQLRGGRPLDPETSTNATAGLVVDTGTLHADRRLLPGRRREPPRPVAELHARGGRARAAAVGRHHVGAHAGLLPVLHQRLLDPDAGARRRVDLVAPRAGRRHGLQPGDEPHRHGGDGRIGAAQPRRRARPGTRRAGDALERRRQPARRAGRPARPPALLRVVGRPPRRALRARRRRAGPRRPLHRRPRGQRGACPRRDAGRRRPERLQHLLGPDGPVRRAVRPPVQPVHAVGIQRRVLLRAPPLRLGRVALRHAGARLRTSWSRLLQLSPHDSAHDSRQPPADRDLQCGHGVVLIVVEAGRIFGSACSRWRRRSMELAVREAKARLSELIAAAQKGERVVITKHGVPAVELVRCRPRGGIDFDKLEETRRTARHRRRR